ncbi:MAG TPA: HAMP domain-containing sensor histidine kinase [Solirubrobacteraceae bacterium]|jgi:two-component system sensor histidine kinase MprB
MTLRARIAAVASVAVALAVLAAAIGLYVAVRSELRGEVDKTLRGRAHGFLPGSSKPPGQEGDFRPPPDPGALPGAGVPGGGFPTHVSPVPLGSSGYVEFISPTGVVRVPDGQGSSPQISPTARDRQIARSGSSSQLTDRIFKGRALRVLTVGAGPNGAVLVARELTEVNHELSHILLILILISVGGVVLAAIMGTLVARTALAPIASFTKRTETLTGSLDLSKRLQVSGRDELARLAESFNVTLDALERSVAAQRHVIADASHELRTPLASLRANIQVLEDAERLPASEQESLRRDIIDELDELTSLVGDVVELARGARSERPPDDVRLDEIVIDAVQRTRRRVQASVLMDLQPTIVTGEPDRIARAVSNLLENARKWSPAGAVIEVGLHEGVLSVRDHGPGFAEVDLPFVFDRFYRADSARKLAGSGLGLAIVRQAAEACGGYASAENAPGGGALLKVSFGAPIAFSPPHASDAHAV